jgi:hypothetical protein
MADYTYKDAKIHVGWDGSIKLTCRNMTPATDPQTILEIGYPGIDEYAKAYDTQPPITTSKGESGE